MATNCWDWSARYEAPHPHATGWENEFLTRMEGNAFNYADVVLSQKKVDVLKRMMRRIPA